MLFVLRGTDCMPKRKKTASVTPSRPSQRRTGADVSHVHSRRLTLASRAEGVARDVLRIVGSEEIADSLAGDLAGIEIEDV